jgi:regulator of telomere elongation helicase 1
MESVLQALNGKGNALLESPTGTGKTLCLLCAVLAWRRHLKERDPQQDVPNLVYASRTHSQLSQVIRELKKTSYSAITKTVTMGSREQLCIHPTVSQLRGHELTMGCIELLQRNACDFFKKFNNNKMEIEDLVDIEDLARAGQQEHVCPYYFSREAVASRNVDLVLLPYNYLIDRNIRLSTDLRIDNAIVVFDEAHNLNDMLCQEASFELTGREFGTMIAEVQKLIKTYESDPTGIAGDVGTAITEAMAVKVLILRLEEAMKRLSEGREAANASSHQAGEGSNNNVKSVGVFTVFEMAQISFDLPGMEVVVRSLANTVRGLERIDRKRKPALSKLVDAIRIVFKTRDSNFERYYRVAIREDQRDGYVLMFLCMHPGVAMADLLQMRPYNLLLASGTLAPMDEYAAELSIEFPVRLEASHVVQRNQVRAFIMSEGPTGKPLNFSFRNRSSSDEVFCELGRMLTNVCRVIPDGVLVFFPSYSVLTTAMDVFKKEGVYGSLMRLKAVFYEQRDKSAGDTLREYMSVIGDGTVQSPGAILFAVARGKVSEGLDFSDRYGRAVVIAGIPFPNVSDPRVMLKYDYMGGAKGTWYTTQAARAVNQAIGRVIRHRNDWGGVLLCDDRFQRKDWQTCYLSHWLRPFIADDKHDFGTCLRQLTNFIKEAKPDVPGKKDDGDKVSKRAIRTRLQARTEKPAITVPGLTTVIVDTDIPVAEFSLDLGKELAKVRGAAEQQEKAANDSRNLLQVLATQKPVHGYDRDGPLPPANPSKPIDRFVFESDAQVVEKDDSVRASKDVAQSSQSKLHADAAQSATTTQTQASSSARDFIANVKLLLTDSAFNSFRLLMRNLSVIKGDMTKSEAEKEAASLESVRGICALLEFSDKLLAAFREFLPKNLKVRYDEVREERQRDQKLEQQQSRSKQPMAAEASTNPNSSTTDRKRGADVPSTSLFEQLQQKRSRPSTASASASASSSSTSAAVVRQPVPNVPNPSAAPKRVKEESSVTTMQGAELICPICMNRPKNPYHAPCSHVCCFGCWEKLFRGNKTNPCPYCRAPTAFRQLKQVKLM